jgi:hypothetical protein
MLVPTLANIIKAAKFLFQKERTGNNRESLLRNMSFLTVTEMLAMLDIFPANRRLIFSLPRPIASWGARKRGRDNWWRLGQDLGCP